MRTRSWIFDRFPDEAAFLDDLARHVRAENYRTILQDGRLALDLPGHDRVPMRPPRRRRLSFRKRPNSVEYEPVVTLLLSRLVQAFGAATVLDIGASAGY